MKKAELLARLRAFPYGTEAFWVVTGAAMVLYGLREETADIDMGCTPEMADRLESEGVPVRVMSDGNRRFRIDRETEVFENWLYDSVAMLEGIPVISLRGLREMKRRLGREKDLRDIERIDAFLARDPGLSSAGPG